MIERPVQSMLEDISFEVSKITKLLGRLKVGKSPGPDGVHNKVLFEIKDQTIISIISEKFSIWSVAQKMERSKYCANL